MEESYELLKKILSIPSVNGTDDEGEVASYLKEVFDAEQIPARIQRIDTTHANVIAVLEGEDPSKTVVWNGHLDTVPYGNRDEWSTDPACPVEKEGYVYARGASDMKSGLAAMVSALCRFHRSGRKPHCNVLFLGTCDEEKNGLGANQILKEYSMDGISGLLIGEPTGCRLGIAQKGCLWLEIRAKGKTSHGAYPEEGCNAIDYGVRVASEIKSYVEGFSHFLLKSATAQITMISGGVAPNMTPDECTVLMDIRMVPALTEAMVLAEAKRIAEGLEKAIPELKFQFTVKNSRRSVEISKDHEMTVKLADRVARQGLPVEYVGINYFTDASVLVKDAPDIGVLLFGPGEPGMAHKPNERVQLKSYEDAIEILMTMLS